tara:strand:+ start:124525 stop:126762 length:2238 start_codon:yes stop_codon:yes gene_type:complete
MLIQRPMQFFCLILCLALGSAGPAGATEDAHASQAGRVVASVDGINTTLPLLKSHYDVKIEGDVATVTVTQTFLNPTSQALNATYLFPLNQKAAVYGMDMRVGDELVKAIIQRKEEAREIFEKAQSEGKAAALLTQHRPNMFTQNIANLMPGQPVQITLRYAQTVPKIDAAYELVVPMVVGPRYEGEVNPSVADLMGLDSDDPAPSADIEDKVDDDEQKSVERAGNWLIEKLPTYPKVIGFNAPSTIDSRRVTLKIDLKSANAVSIFSSATHELETAGDEKAIRAHFKPGAQIDNRDFVLRYALAADSDITAGALAHYDARGGFLSLLIEPPKMPKQGLATPRELIFVLDTSGSMSGAPLRASQVFMHEALKNMRPDDHFRILSFADTTSQFASNPIAATPDNIQEGLRYVSGLTAGGGTQMNDAIRNAFTSAPLDDAMRIIIFLTDGYIGGDREVIATVAQQIGNARLYAFGVGSSVNRFLLEGMANEGRGYVRYIEPGELAFEVAETFARDLKTPLLTDISVDWNGLAIEGQSPAKIRDLFEGGSVRVFARYKEGGKHTIFVKGRINGRQASMPVEISLPMYASGEESAIPIIWARQQIFDKNRTYIISGQPDGLKEQITQLGLRFSLQSAFTAFVAVSQKVVNQDPQNAQSKQVPLPKVANLSTNAYPSLNLSGSSAPEPAGFIGIFLVIGLAVARYWRQLKSTLVAMRRRNARTLPVEISRAQVPTRLARDGWWLDGHEIQ